MDDCAQEVMLRCMHVLSITVVGAIVTEQEAHGPRFAHLSDIATAGMQMFPIIYANIQP